jgi:hypothetical protein
LIDASPDEDDEFMSWSVLAHKVPYDVYLSSVYCLMKMLKCIQALLMMAIRKQSEKVLKI